MKNSNCRRPDKALALWEQGPQKSLGGEMPDRVCPTNTKTT